jgi:hypothetical protein
VIAAQAISSVRNVLSRCGVPVMAPTTPSPCPHANTTFVCIKMDGFIANFNARQYPSGSIALR